jgi:hypothetical protein
LTNLNLLAIGISLAASDLINMANFVVLISVCKDLVLYISQFREGKLTAAVAVALEAYEIGSGTYVAVRVIVSAALVGMEKRILSSDIGLVYMPGAGALGGGSRVYRTPAWPLRERRGLSYQVHYRAKGLVEMYLATSCKESACILRPFIFG